MAVVFELSVCFESQEARDRAALIAARQAPIPAGRHRIPLHGPFRIGTRVLEIRPIAVSHGTRGMDGTLPPFELTYEEETLLGHGLYQLLAKFDCYLTAQVGWDPDRFLGVPYEEEEWAPELAAGDLDGLVLAEPLVQKLSVGGEFFMPFAPGFMWIPWQGR